MKIGVENRTDSPMYVGGMMIPAGETRHFEPEALPAEYRPAPVVEDAPEAGPDALAVILEGSVREVLAGVDASLETALMLERKANQLLFATRDQKEGMQAFIEKRKPKFEGR